MNLSALVQSTEVLNVQDPEIESCFRMMSLNTSNVVGSPTTDKTYAPPRLGAFQERLPELLELPLHSIGRLNSFAGRQVEDCLDRVDFGRIDKRVRA